MSLYQPYTYADVMAERRAMAEHQAELDKRKKLSPQCRLLLKHLEAGHAITPLVSAVELGVMALSQRMGELRRAGYPVAAEMVKLPSGKRVARYSLVRDAR